MERHYLLPFFLLGIASAPAQTITITFEGTFEATPVPLDSILVMNLTQGGDTTITFPGNTLVLGTTGLSDLNERGSHLLAQPNPFTGSNEIVVGTATAGELLLYVHDAMGRELASQRLVVRAGQHRFQFTAATSGIHLVSTIHNGQRRTLRMVAVGEGNATAASLAYTGASERTGQLKSGTSTFVWDPGDELRYIGYASSGGLVLSDAIDEVPVATATRTFTLLRGAVCPGSPTVTDIDGNVYRTAQVGQQCWTAKELRTGTFANGDAIPNVTGTSQWLGLSSGAWCHYNNDPANEPAYGRLYNWFAATDARGLCPAGWHVPSDAEWNALEIAVGMPPGEANQTGSRGSAQNTGGKLRSLDLWPINFPGALDAVGMAMPPNGQRNAVNGNSSNLNIAGYWWTTTPVGANNAWIRTIASGINGVVRTDFGRPSGYGVRCVRD